MDGEEKNKASATMVEENLPKKNKPPENKYPGLKFILFVKSLPDSDKKESWFECILCSALKRMNPKEMVAHMRSTDHLSNLVKLECPQLVCECPDNPLEMAKSILAFEASQTPKQSMVAANPGNIDQKREEISNLISSLRKLVDGEGETVQRVVADATESSGKLVTLENESQVTTSEVTSLDGQTSKDQPLPSAKTEQDDGWNIEDDFTDINTSDSDEEKPLTSESFEIAKEIPSFKHSDIKFDKEKESKYFRCLRKRAKSALNDDPKMNEIPPIPKFDTEKYAICQRGSQGKQNLMFTLDHLRIKCEELLSWKPDHPYKDFVEKSLTNSLVAEDIKTMDSEEMSSVKAQSLDILPDFSTSHKGKLILVKSKSSEICQLYHSGLRHPSYEILKEIISQEFETFSNFEKELLDVIDNCSICKHLQKDFITAHNAKVLQAYREWPQRRAMRNIRAFPESILSHERCPKKLVVICDERVDILSKITTENVPVNVYPGLTMKEVPEIILNHEDFNKNTLFLVFAGIFDLIRFDTAPTCGNLKCDKPPMLPKSKRGFPARGWRYLAHQSALIHRKVIFNSQTDDVIFGPLQTLSISDHFNDVYTTHVKDLGQEHSWDFEQPSFEYYKSFVLAVFAYNKWARWFNQSLGYPPFPLTKKAACEDIWETPTGIAYRLQMFKGSMFELSPSYKDLLILEFKKFCEAVTKKLSERKEGGLMRNYMIFQNPFLSRENQENRVFDKVVIFSDKQNLPLIDEFKSSKVLIFSETMTKSSLTSFAEEHGLVSANVLCLFVCSMHSIFKQKPIEQCDTLGCCSKAQYHVAEMLYLSSTQSDDHKVHLIMDYIKEQSHLANKVFGSKSVNVILPAVPFSVVDLGSSEDPNFFHEEIHTFKDSGLSFIFTNLETIKQLLPLFMSLLKISFLEFKKGFEVAGLKAPLFSSLRLRLDSCFQFPTSVDQVGSLARKWRDMMSDLLDTAFVGFTPHINDPPEDFDVFNIKQYIPPFLDSKYQRVQDSRFNRVVIIVSKPLSPFVKHWASKFVTIIPMNLDSSEKELSKYLQQLKSFSAETLFICAFNFSMITEPFLSSTSCLASNCRISLKLRRVKQSVNGASVSPSELIRVVIESIYSNLTTISKTINKMSSLIVAPLCPFYGILPAKFGTKYFHRAHSQPRTVAIDLVPGTEEEWAEMGTIFDAMWMYLMEAFNPNIGLPYKLFLRYESSKKSSIVTSTLNLFDADKLEKVSSWKNTLAQFINISLCLKTNGKISDDFKPLCAPTYQKNDSLSSGDHNLDCPQNGISGCSNHPGDSSQQMPAPGDYPFDNPHPDSIHGFNSGPPGPFPPGPNFDHGPRPPFGGNNFGPDLSYNSGHLGSFGNHPSFGPGPGPGPNFNNDFGPPFGPGPNFDGPFPPQIMHGPPPPTYGPPPQMYGPVPPMHGGPPPIRGPPSLRQQTFSSSKNANELLPPGEEAPTTASKSSRTTEESSIVISKQAVMYSQEESSIQPSTTEPKSGQGDEADVYRVLVGKIHKTRSDEEVKEILAAIGDFIDFERPKVKNISCGVAKFSSVDAANRCVRLLDQYPFPPGFLEVRVLFPNVNESAGKEEIDLEKDEKCRMKIREITKGIKPLISSSIKDLKVLEDELKVTEAPSSPKQQKDSIEETEDNSEKSKPMESDEEDLHLFYNDLMKDREKSAGKKSATVGTDKGDQQKEDVPAAGTSLAAAKNDVAPIQAEKLSSYLKNKREKNLRGKISSLRKEVDRDEVPTSVDFASRPRGRIRSRRSRSSDSQGSLSRSRSRSREPSPRRIRRENYTRNPYWSRSNPKGVYQPSFRSKFGRRSRSRSGSRPRFDRRSRSRPLDTYHSTSNFRSRRRSRSGSSPRIPRRPKSKVDRSSRSRSGSNQRFRRSRSRSKIGAKSKRTKSDRRSKSNSKSRSGMRPNSRSSITIDLRSNSRSSSPNQPDRPLRSGSESRSSSSFSRSRSGSPSRSKFISHYRRSNSPLEQMPPDFGFPPGHLDPRFMRGWGPRGPGFFPRPRPRFNAPPWDPSFGPRGFRPRGPFMPRPRHPIPGVGPFFEILITNLPIMTSIKFFNAVVIACGSPTPCKPNENGPGIMAQFSSLKRATMVAHQLHNRRVLDKVLNVKVLADTREVKKQISVLEETTLANEIKSVFEEFNEVFVNNYRKEINKMPDVFTFKINQCDQENCREFDCLNYHNSMDRRRDYLRVKYSDKLCQKIVMDSLTCENQDFCLFSHNSIEKDFHPKKFKRTICLDWYELESCPKEGFCSKFHPMSADSFFCDEWADVFVAGLNQSIFYFAGAVKLLYKVPDTEGGVPVMFISPVKDIVLLAAEVIKPLEKIHRLKVAVIVEPDQTPGGADVLVGTPAALAHLVKTKGSEPLGGLRVLVLDDVTTLLNNPLYSDHVNLILQSIYKEVNDKSSICKVAVSGSCHSSEVAKVKALLQSNFSVVNPYKIDPQINPLEPTPDCKKDSAGPSAPQLPRGASPTDDLSDWESVYETTSRHRRKVARSKTPIGSSSASSSDDSDSSDGSTSAGGKSTLTASLRAEKLEEVKLLEKELNDEYKVYLEVPEMHSRYEEKYESFLNSYKQKYNTLDESDHMNKLWIKYWKRCVDYIKVRHLKTKKKELDKKYEHTANLPQGQLPSSVGQHSSLPVLSASAILSAITEISSEPLGYFTVVDALDLLQDLGDRVGGETGASVKSVLNCAKSLGVNTIQSMELIRNEANMAHMNKLFEQLLIRSQVSSSTDRELFRKGIAWGLNLIKVAKEFKEVRKPDQVAMTTEPKVRFDVNLFARQTFNKDIESIYETLRQSLEYVYGEKPSEDLVNHTFQAISAIHLNMASCTPYLTASAPHYRPASHLPDLSNIPQTVLQDAASGSSQFSTIPLTPLIPKSSDGKSSYSSFYAPTPLVYSASAGLSNVMGRSSANNHGSRSNESASNSIATQHAAETSSHSHGYRQNSADYNRQSSADYQHLSYVSSNSGQTANPYPPSQYPYSFSGVQNNEKTSATTAPSNDMVNAILTLAKKSKNA